MILWWKFGILLEVLLVTWQLYCTLQFLVYHPIMHCLIRTCKTRTSQLSTVRQTRPTGGQEYMENSVRLHLEQLRRMLIILNQH